MSGNVLLRQAQHNKSNDAVTTIEFARAFVAGKLKNSRQVLLRAARESTDADEGSKLTRTSDNLAASLRALPEAQDLDTLRGVEGEAARAYFTALNLVVRPDYRSAFQMNGRLERRLLAEIDEQEDCLRLYRFTEPTELRVKQHGAFRSVDFEGPLVI